VPVQGPATRVTFVLPDFEAGGAQRVIVAIANAIDRTRFTPSIVVLDDRGPWRELVAEDIEVTGLGRARLRYALAALRTALRRAAPDVIVSTIGYLNLGVLMNRPRTSRVIVRESNTPSHAPNSPLARAAQRLAYAALYRRADCVISPSDLIGEELTRDYHVPRPLIHVVRNPVDEAALRTAANPPRRRPGEGARFVAVGRLSRQKGYDRLLEAAASASADSHITVFGEGDERAALEAQARTLGIAGRVIFAGFDPNPAPWFAGADALLLPSRWEGLPNVALEALACGTPVIAAPEAGGIHEIARGAKQGAVMIASMGTEFLATMAALPCNDRAQLRPSLLPDEFRLATVVAEFERQLAHPGRPERSAA
jgi:glycosyltransferase involved in cell wall biosynthesis